MMANKYSSAHLGQIQGCKALLVIKSLLILLQLRDQPREAKLRHRGAFALGPRGAQNEVFQPSPLIV